MEDESPKITSVLKSEKIKDPKKVAQGKKLAAISRQAKERKAKEREASIRKEEREHCEEGNGFLKYSSVLIPIILFGGYYLFYLRKEEKEPEELRKKTVKPNEGETDDSEQRQEPDLECL